MTETTEHSSQTSRKNLSSMVLADLKVVAGELGIKGISSMRKGELIDTIKQRQNGHSSPSTGAPSAARRAASRRAGAPDAQPALTDAVNGAPPAAAVTGRDPARVNGSSPNDSASNDSASNGSASNDSASNGSAAKREPAERTGTHDGGESRSDDGRGSSDRDSKDGGQSRRDDGNNNGQGGKNGRASRNDGKKSQNNQGDGKNSQNPNDGKKSQNSQGDGKNNQSQNNQSQNNQNDSQNDRDDRGGRRRGRRYRDRNRRNRGGRYSEGGEPEIREDDVLLPVSGVVDVLDSYAFVRTTGYLAGPKDVYVSMSQVRKYGLRRGDQITGSIKAPREGEQQSQRQKYTPLAKLETINGLDPEMMRSRPEFTKLTPLYPNQRLRLETSSKALTTRVIDLVMPVGKGQRALIVSPPKAGKTSVLQAIANAITTNNPECHLMVVLVDERPEEVTDMERSVDGEVIASTFDRPPADHTSVAELSIERAKRLVEMGKDVVVLLDSITRLGRAYNLAAPASGRILSGGVDSTALFPPKRFLGAARNIENGGSLTIFASALVETGSAGDTVIFEEFKGTGNAELKLDRRLADKRLFPAIDVDASSTRKEELLMGPDELAVMVKLRRVLSALEPQQALELVLDKLRKSQTNAEFLMTVAKNMPMTE